MENRIETIYYELRQKGFVATRKEFADRMGVNYTNLSSAMNGDPRAYTDKMIARAEMCRKELLDGTPALAPAPVRKEIVIPPETMELYTNLSRTAAQLAETLDRLLSGETKKGAV